MTTTRNANPRVRSRISRLAGCLLVGLAHQSPALAGIGDINGDGYDDVVIGVPSQDVGNVSPTPPAHRARRRPPGGSLPQLLGGAGPPRELWAVRS